MIMSALRRAVALVAAGAGVQGRRQTLTAENVAEIEAFRRMVDLGHDDLRGFTARTRREILEGIEIMRTRCPQVLVMCVGRRDFETIANYKRSRRTTV